MRRTTPRINILKPKGICNVTSKANPVKRVKKRNTPTPILFHILILTRSNKEKENKERNICSKKTVKKAPIVAKRNPIILLLQILLIN